MPLAREEIRDLQTGLSAAGMATFSDFSKKEPIPEGIGSWSLFMEEDRSDQHWL
jgi:hypothetical protein